MDLQCPITLSVMNGGPRVPIIMVTINGKEVMAQPDTGATISVLGGEVVRRLGCHVMPYIGASVKTAEGRFFRPDGIVSFVVHYSDIAANVTAAVVNGLKDQILLGVDFLEAIDAVISFKGKQIVPFSQFVDQQIDRIRSALEVKPRTIQAAPTISTEQHTPQAAVCMFKLNEDVTLLPLEEVSLSVMKVKAVNGPVEFVGSTALQEKEHITISDGIIEGFTPNCSVIVKNSGLEPLILRSETKLGYGFEIGEDDIVTLDADDSNEFQVMLLKSKPKFACPKFLEQFRYGDHLTAAQRQSLQDLLLEYADIFGSDLTELGRFSQVKHQIKTTGGPVSSRPYRTSHAELDVLKDFVSKLLRAKMVRPSQSPWASPVVLVKREGKPYRLCIDYRKLNQVTVKDSTPQPRLDEVLDLLSGSACYSTMDVANMYWQVEMEEADIEKTAFVVPFGSYESLVMPQGCTGAPATCTRVMNIVLGELNRKICFFFFDDILCFSKTFEEQIFNLRKIFEKLRHYDLKIKPSKCSFCVDQVTYLGYTIKPDGILPTSEKTRAIDQMKAPRSKEELRSFIGLMNFYRRFIKNFAMKAEPLNKMLRGTKEFVMGPEHVEAFQTLKKCLMCPPVLCHYDPQAELELRTDACDYGIGGILLQVKDGEKKVLTYLSRTLNPAERNYSITEKECLAVKWCIKQLRHYLYGRCFTVVTDHCSLCWLLNLREPNGRLARWALELQPYDFKIVYKSGKTHADADCISRNPLYEPTNLVQFVEVDMESVAVFSIKADEQDLGEVKGEQEQDSYCKRYLDIITDESIPLNVRQKKAKSFKIFNQLLYKQVSRQKKRRYVLVIPKSQIQRVLTECHDVPTAGHLGVTKTYDRIRNRFFWPKMFKHVLRYVTSCSTCQLKKDSNLKKAGLMQLIPVASKPFETVSIDLMGEFSPISSSRNRYIIVVTDQLTRFAISEAVQVSDSKTVIRFLRMKVFMVHGIPRTLVSDRGTNLTSEEFESFLNLYGVKHNLTTAYRPQADGQTERFNKVLGNMIRTMVDDRGRNWDAALPELVYAYNTSLNETTGFSPFYLIYGREARIPIEGQLGVEANGKDISLEELSYAREVAQRNFQDGQLKNKKFYDEKRSDVQLEVGDLVAIKNNILQKGKSKKLIPRFKGPFKVMKKLNDVNYQVVNLKGKFKTDVVHIERMKKFHPRLLNILEVPVNLSNKESRSNSIETVGRRSGRLTKKPDRLNYC